jgi:hypothetical protein
LHTYRGFPVDKKLGCLMIEITVSVTSGTISFMLAGPNGKNMHYLIDATTNMEFRHTLNLKKIPEYTGDWKIFIEANNAIGSYCLNMRTTVM